MHISTPASASLSISYQHSLFGAEAKKKEPEKKPNSTQAPPPSDPPTHKPSDVNHINLLPTHMRIGKPIDLNRKEITPLPAAPSRTRRSTDNNSHQTQSPAKTLKKNQTSTVYDRPAITTNNDQGKRAGPDQQIEKPVDIGSNIDIERQSKIFSDEFKSPEQKASIFLKEEFQKKWGLKIDPDNTYLVAYDYNTTGRPPYPAKIVERISLTDALIKNSQDTPTGNGYPISFPNANPDIKPQDTLQINSPKIFDFATRISPYRENADTTHFYEGIYVESPDSTTKNYNASNRLSVPPAAFRSLTWDTDFQKPYSEFLSDFWSKHEKNYPALAKASLIKAAMVQRQENSLTDEAQQLVMRALGLPDNKKPWSEITFEQLLKPGKKPSNVSTELLKIGNYKSTDIMVISDKQQIFDAEENKKNTTLLYIPGNSSPIHSFNSQAQMKDWLAKQMNDPVKRNALVAHFALKDKPNGTSRAGIVETLTGLGTWPEKRVITGGIFSYENRAFSGYWSPQEYIKSASTDSPFQAITYRQKDRSYADAAVKIVSDRDVNKKHFMDGLHKFETAALFLAPLALVMPEVALALDAIYLADSAATVGVGIDDKQHDKPKGNDRILFGALNALPIVVGVAGTAVAKQAERAANTIHPDIELSNEISASLPEIATKKISLPVRQGEILSDLKPFASNYITAGRTPDNFGVYHIDHIEYVPIKNDGTNGSALYQVRRSEKAGQFEMVKPGQTISWNAPKVAQDESGAFRTVKNELRGGGLLDDLKYTTNPKYRSAKKKLSNAINEIKRDKNSLNDIEKQKFSDSLQKLSAESKAQNSKSIVEYVDKDVDQLNNALRTEFDDNNYPDAIKKFLSDFKLQANYEGQAYRFVYVKPEGAEALKNGLGKVFRDRGIQSSSTQASNVKGWDNWGAEQIPSSDRKAAIFVFDEYVPKKNISTSQLKDHVAIPPNTSLEVRATREDNGLLYIYFGAPLEMPEVRYDLHDGTVAKPF